MNYKYYTLQFKTATRVTGLISLIDFDMNGTLPLEDIQTSADKILNENKVKSQSDEVFLLSI